MCQGPYKALQLISANDYWTLTRCQDCAKHGTWISCSLQPSCPHHFMTEESKAQSCDHMTPRSVPRNTETPQMLAFIMQLHITMMTYKTLLMSNPWGQAMKYSKGGIYTCTRHRLLWCMAYKAKSLKKKDICRYYDNEHNAN